MTTTDRAQDHIRIARDCLGMADKKPKKHLRSLAWSLAAQANATLAVAHELRTANLIAVVEWAAHPIDVTAWPTSRLDRFNAAQHEITTRLGLDGGAGS